MNKWVRRALTFFVYLIILGIILGIVFFAIYKPNQWVALIFSSVVLLIVINMLFALYIFFSFRNDVRKKSWILFFAVVPILAPFFFLWFGYNPFTKKEMKKLEQHLQSEVHQKERKIYETNNEIVDVLQKTYHQYVFSNLVNGQVKYIDVLEDSYKEMVSLIREAKSYIILNYFIIGDGVYLKTIVNELKKKKDEGVKIYFAYDWVWTEKHTTRKLIKKLKAELGLVVFKPKRQLLVASIHNNRNHKKYLIVDGVKALYGGSNLSDEYINQNPQYNYWHDTNFIIEGDIVKSLVNTFTFDSDYFASPQLTYSSDILKDKQYNPDCNLSQPYCWMWDSYPEIEFTTCLNVYKSIIPYIKKELIISTPYLYPTKELTDLIRNAIHKGVKVKFLLPGLPDNKKIVVWLNRNLYQQFLEMGVEIYEINAFNHGKFWIIDDDLTLITSVNLDPRATVINYESSILYHDAIFNQTMRNALQTTLSHAHRITQDDLTSRKWNKKIYWIKYFAMLFEPAL